ncbi:MAG: cob(I)yrinic acid a,c-diamide adenosyltransferase [Candidatus Omnitrophica bacterium]|nr:cob(I)yrinic acid a,c-diamide adenosyltransferase [Candidatus Omnitrophota bacterium]
MIQVYTGKGKGKTTAALGLALRAAGAGLKVYIIQFVKGKTCGEHRALKKFKNIKVEQFGRGCFVKKINEEDKKLFKSGLLSVKKALKNKKYDLVILDEINVALKLGLLDCSELIRILKNAPRKQEVILTGRNAPCGILELADLVSEIKEVKHYFHKGVPARKGIEY